MRTKSDCSNVRVMTEEAPRMASHSPAMVTTSDGTINIIPTPKWPADPVVWPVVSHESDHIVLITRFDLETSTKLDNLPAPENELFHRAGIYGWNLARMTDSPKWKELMAN